ncbi:uncharacterized protein [Euphorbia lathyris]|uniref:uncharacterized protein n=1 Tax=Euphorbia lathyris TaxID=212925 RepID=UPI0033143EBD
MLIIHTPISRCTTPPPLQPPSPPHIFFIKGKISSSSVAILHKTTTTGTSRSFNLKIASFFAALAVVTVVGTAAPAPAAPRPQQQSQLEDSETLSNIPQTLSGGDCESTDTKDCKRPKIQRPKSRKAESCTIKCVTTCIRGGEGSLNIIRPLVVFKQGFRSRQYCLVECSDICNLIPDGDDGS